MTPRCLSALWAAAVSLVAALILAHAAVLATLADARADLAWALILLHLAH
jgi:hypothetical protein